MTLLPATHHDLVSELVRRWRDDPGATYRSWFLWDERLKNFRSIRRGLQQVVAEIESGRFGVAHRGSSLETVVHSIAEQRQIFKGADHAWLWKPKLRIPDIYESPDNQRAFGRLLDNCSCCDTAEEIISHIRSIDALKIKGLGPAAANLLYFLHPTLVPPFNTAIVKGYNAVTGAKVKLGSWDHFSPCAPASSTSTTVTASCSPTISARSADCCSTLARAAIPRHRWRMTQRRPTTGSADWNMPERRQAGSTRQPPRRAETRSHARRNPGPGCATSAMPSVTMCGSPPMTAVDFTLAARLDRMPRAPSRRHCDLSGADSIRLIDVLWLAKGGDGVRRRVRG